MTTASDRIPTVTRADHIPGPLQGLWTYKDYIALPEDGHKYEIVNGVLYLTPSPTGAHQDAVLRFAHYLLIHVEEAGYGKVRVAPFDVELTSDTVVQPDLVVEVASPGTATYDRRGKLDSYTQAGVPEYWIVDTASHTVEILVLENSVYQSQGVFRGKAGLPSKIVPTIDAVKVEQFFA